MKRQDNDVSLIIYVYRNYILSCACSLSLVLVTFSCISTKLGNINEQNKKIIIMEQT